MDTMEKNLHKIKMKGLATGVDKISEYNKWAEKKTNRVLIWILNIFKSNFDSIIHTGISKIE